MNYKCKYIYSDFAEVIEASKEEEAVSVFAKNFALAHRLQETTLQVNVSSEEGISNYTVTLTSEVKTNCKKI